MEFRTSSNYHHHPRQRQRHNQQFSQQRCRTQYQQYWFLLRTIRDSNDLPRKSWRQQETPGTPVRTTWTDTGDCQHCQVPGCYHQQAMGHELERAHQQHVHKANKTLGFLKRNLKISSRKIKEMAYKSCVRTALEYACTVWDPHTQQPIDRIEATQHQAACFVM